MGFLCANVSAPICIFLFYFVFAFSCLVLSYYNLFLYILFYFTLLFSLRSLFFFSNEKHKGMNPDERGSGEEL